MDREKVISNITAIVADMQEEVDEWKDYSDSELRGGLTCDCDWWFKTLQTLKEALALLKAQEPVEPVFDAGDGKTIGQFLCGKCHAKIGFGYPHFCWYCGREVKWDG